MPILVIKTDAGEFVSHRLNNDLVTIGRHPDNLLVIEDVLVSAHHAEIILKQKKHILRDLNSTNGTKINGNYITEKELQYDDTITFGNIEVIFREEKQEPSNHSAKDELKNASSAILGKTFGSGKNKLWLVVAGLPVFALIIIVFMYSCHRANVPALNKENKKIGKQEIENISDDIKSTIEKQQKDEKEIREKLNIQKSEDERKYQQERDAQKKEIEKTKTRIAEEKKISDAKKTAAIDAQRKEQEDKDKQVSALKSVGNGSTISAMKGLSDIILFDSTESLTASKWIQSSLSGNEGLQRLLQKSRKAYQDPDDPKGYMEFGYGNTDSRLFGTPIRALQIWWVVSPNDLKTPIIGGIHFKAAHGYKFDVKEIRRVISDQCGPDDKAAQGIDDPFYVSFDWTDKANPARVLKISALAIEYGDFNQLEKDFVKAIKGERVANARGQVTQSAIQELSPNNAKNVDELKSIGGITLFAPIATLSSSKWADYKANVTSNENAALPLNDWLQKIIPNAYAIENNVKSPQGYLGSPHFTIYTKKQAALMDRPLFTVEIQWAATADKPNNPVIAEVEFIFANKEDSLIAGEVFRSQFGNPNSKPGEDLVWSSPADNCRKLTVTSFSVKWGDAGQYRDKVQSAKKNTQSKVDSSDIMTSDHPK